MNSFLVSPRWLKRRLMDFCHFSNRFALSCDNRHCRNKRANSSWLSSWQRRSHHREHHCHPQWIFFWIPFSRHLCMAKKEFVLPPSRTSQKLARNLKRRRSNIYIAIDILNSLVQFLRTTRSVLVVEKIHYR